MNILKIQSIISFAISFIILLPVAMNYQGALEQPELRILVLTYGGISLFFILLGLLLYYLYYWSDTGRAKELNENIQEASYYYNEDIKKKDYTILNKPKKVVFFTVLWLGVFLLYIVVSVISSKHFSMPFYGLSTYNLIMFMSLGIGLYFFYNLNPNGYLILWGVVIYNLVRIILVQQYTEMLFWVFPVLSLVNIHQIFVKP